MKTNMFSLKTLLFLTLIFSFATGFAQKTRNIIGTVLTGDKDDLIQNDAENVHLTLVNKVSGKTFKATSDETGKFCFKKVPIGKYTMDLKDVDYRMPSSFVVNIDGNNSSDYKLDAFYVSQKVSWLFNWGDRGKKEHYWSHLVAIIVLCIYAFCLLLVFVYSILQLTLSVGYHRTRKTREQAPKKLFDPALAQKVTIQLPMYNEAYVAERIIDACAQFDYPRDRFDIQVLDDSTDETKDIIAQKVAEIAATGVDIKHIHRVDRTGYKAGALDAAMDDVKGEFIAIFDADFVPDADFLQKTMPYFDSAEVGVVQTRWGHLNKSYSLLTELQAFGLNGHFAVEQGGRNAAGHFINFNGTGGIWRKACIESAGGWEHDTLTEDLDLSYRAQMRGWKFKYLEHVVAPAELPITMSALKAQQHRWMKGGAECFVKMWKSVLTFKGVKTSDRIHGMAHLFNSSVFLFILLMSLLSLVVLHIKDSFEDLNHVLKFGMIFISSTLFLMYYYWLAFRDKTSNGFTSFFRFVGRFFQFLVVSLGLSLSNTVAVLEGYLGIKSSFVRTPKFNVAKKGEFTGNKYDKKSISIITIAEGVLMCVFGFTAIHRTLYLDFGMVPFHAMLACGYGLVFFNTLKELRNQG